LSAKINVLANVVGRFGATVISIIFLPLYIKLLGIESYGLVAFYSTLLGSMTILDLGLSATLNRELAKFKTENKSPEDIRNLAFSLEIIYCLIGVGACLIIVLLSGGIANYWLNLETLPPAKVKNAVALMAIVVALQWPISLYEGGLRGLEKHLVNNGIIIATATLRALGALAVLTFLSSSITAFFIWQAVLSSIYVITMRFALWKHMPKCEKRPVYSKAQLKLVWRFAAGMTGVGLITFLLSQIDKILLSKILILSQFGYYNLAFTIASSIIMVVAPISLTFFPQFTKLYAAMQYDELARVYHQTCKFISIIVFPVCFTLILFMKDILLVWTKNEETVNNTYLLAQVLVAGSMLNALMAMPYNLIIAAGWTKFTLYQNAIAALILVPLLFIWTNSYGALGATFVWLSVNVGYVFISQPLMHKKLLKGELKRWYLNDVFYPMIAPLLLLLVIKFIIEYSAPATQLNLVSIGCIGIVTFILSSLLDTTIRNFFKGLLKFT
jgi:O-antigen/teichoic acid export membrane protein